MSKYRDGLILDKTNSTEFKLTIEDVTRLEKMLSEYDFKEFVAKLSINN